MIIIVLTLFIRLRSINKSSVNVDTPQYLFIHITLQIVKQFNKTKRNLLNAFVTFIHKTFL